MITVMTILQKMRNSRLFWISPGRRVKDEWVANTKMCSVLLTGVGTRYEWEYVLRIEFLKISFEPDLLNMHQYKLHTGGECYTRNFREGLIGRDSFRRLLPIYLSGWVYKQSFLDTNLWLCCLTGFKFGGPTAPLRSQRLKSAWLYSDPLYL